MSRLQTGPIILLVSDLDRAKDYYMNVLGCVHDDCGHTSREGLFLLMHEAKYRSAVRPISSTEGGPSWDILVYTNDHENLFEEFKSRGAIIHSEIITSEESGWKEFIIEDLDGYRIGFGG